MSHRPTKCCPAIERRMSVCLSPRLLRALCRKQTWEWAQWVWMDSENIQYTCLFFRFNSGQPRSGNLCVWISHWESLLGCCGWLNSPASEEEMPMESSVCFLLPLSALFTKSRWEEARLSTLLAHFSIQRKLSFVKVSFKTKVLWSLDIKRDHALKPDSAVSIYIWFYYRWTLLLHNILRGPPAVSFISEIQLLICEMRAVHCSHSTDCVLYRFFL